MEPFDNRLKELAEQEEIIVPNGFDERIKNTLDSLPSRAKKGLGAAKIMLIAAAACAALLCTAFAASPSLRDALADALGGFAPYAQKQEGETYVIDGMEFRVVSVLADDFTIRAYVEARDLEGDRLGRLELNTPGSVRGLVELPQEETSAIASFINGGVCLGYDEETKTALLAITNWGQVMPEDLTGSKLLLFSLEKTGYPTLWRNTETVRLPVEIEPIPSVTADAELAAAMQAEEVRLSSLSLSVILNPNEGAWYHYAGANASVKLTDGTVVDAPWEGGQGSYGAYGTEAARKVLVWNFREPVDVETIEGIYIGGEYFPVQ